MEPKTITLPELNEGEFYAGIVLKEDGTPDYHLIGLPGELEAANHSDATEWAASIGGSLPDRRELNLLRANARQYFQNDWCWSNETHAATSYDAWYQDFDFGYQSIYDKSNELRARAIRRLPIQ